MIFDDGSTLNFDYDTDAWLATPSDAAEMVQDWSGGSSFDIFGALDRFSNLATKVGGTIVTLQSQADAFLGTQAARDLQRAQQAAMIGIGKTQAEIAAINAQRELALAQSSPLSSSHMLMLLGLAGVVAYALSQ